MNTSYDKFIRTTDEYHEKQVQKIFKKMYAKGDIYKGYYEGMYCTPCESFFTESQLVDGKCPDCGREVQPAREEAYFFKMSKYAQKLIDYINEHPELVEQFQTAYAESVQWVLDNPAEAAQLAEKYLGMKAAVVEKAIPNMGLTFKSAEDAKSELDTFYQLLNDFNAKMIGGKLPDDAMYYHG